VCLLTETANSGIFVLEGPVRGQRLPIRRESVVAFVGSASRGPVGIPVAIRRVDEYRRRFGTPGHRSRIQDLLAQFFANGGANAIFVRVCGSERRHRLIIPGAAGDLVLHAVNPGPHECLRASVDYDGIPAADEERFNLVIHRLASHDKPIIEEQEIYRALSVDPGDPDFLTHALVDSELAYVAGTVPLTRPDVTHCPGLGIGAAYEYGDDDWREHSPLTDYDLVGSNTEGSGIFALDRIPVVDLICVVPDADDLGPVALFAAERYCRDRQALLFVDPPARWKSVADVVRERMSSDFSSPNVATYFPRPVAKPGTGLNRTPSALGALIGRLVADDANLGVWGVRGSDSLDIRCRTMLACPLDDHDQVVLKRVGVNTLRASVGGVSLASGLVTMEHSSGMDAEWSDLQLRRLGLFIIGSIARGTRWAAFVEDDAQAWEDVRRQISTFMGELHAAGALPGRSANEAWYVSRDREVPVTGARDDGVSGSADFIVGFALDANGYTAFRFAHGRLDCRIRPVSWQPGIALAS